MTIHICPNIRWYVCSLVSKNKDYIYEIWQYKALGMKKAISEQNHLRDKTCLMYKYMNISAWLLGSRRLALSTAMFEITSKTHPLIMLAYPCFANNCNNFWLWWSVWPRQRLHMALCSAYIIKIVWSWICSFLSGKLPRTSCCFSLLHSVC